MFRKWLVQLGILPPVEYERGKYLVTVYVMSEGTAQGIPRPLQVFKLPLEWEVKVERHMWRPKHRVESEVAHIVRRGYTHTLADGTNVTYPPHTIYKVTSKEITDA